MNTTNRQDNDIFTGLVPYCFFCFIVHQDIFDGDAKHSALRLLWEYISNVQASINGEKVRTIDLL